MTEDATHCSNDNPSIGQNSGSEDFSVTFPHADADQCVPCGAGGNDQRQPHHQPGIAAHDEKAGVQNFAAGQRTERDQRSLGASSTGGRRGAPRTATSEAGREFLGRASGAVHFTEAVFHGGGSADYGRPCG